MLHDFNTDFKLKDYLFGAVKLTKNADPNMYSHSGYFIEKCEKRDLYSKKLLPGIWKKFMVLLLQFTYYSQISATALAIHTEKIAAL